MRLRSTTWLIAAVIALCGAFGTSSVSPLAAAPESANQVTSLEVRLAEVQPAAGLIEASMPGSSEKIYLHREIVVTNADVVQARVVPGNGGSDFSITVGFTREGAVKMAQATASHLNRPLAILINGQVVTAPTLRDPISDSAVIYGNFTSSDAAAIAEGLNRK